MVLNIIALVFSAAALGFSIFVYIRHDKRLKPLELEIAQHQVNEIHEQEAAKAIANLNARSRYVAGQFIRDNHKQWTGLCI